MTVYKLRVLCGGWSNSVQVTKHPDTNIVPLNEDNINLIIEELSAVLALAEPYLTNVEGKNK
jgi:hypothetical protein